MHTTNRLFRLHWPCVDTTRTVHWSRCWGWIPVAGWKGWRRGGGGQNDTPVSVLCRLVSSVSMQQDQIMFSAPLVLFMYLLSNWFENDLIRKVEIIYTCAMQKEWLQTTTRLICTSWFSFSSTKPTLDVIFIFIYQILVHLSFIYFILFYLLLLLEFTSGSFCFFL